MTRTTVIKNIGWAIVWDDDEDQHVYARNIDLAVHGTEIVFIGPDFQGESDEVIDGSDRLVLPGLINIHSHAAHEPAEKGVRDLGAKQVLEMATVDGAKALNWDEGRSRLGGPLTPQHATCS